MAPSGWPGKPRQPLVASLEDPPFTSASGNGRTPANSRDIRVWPAPTSRIAATNTSGTSMRTPPCHVLARRGLSAVVCCSAPCGLPRPELLQPARLRQLDRHERRPIRPSTTAARDRSRVADVSSTAATSLTEVGDAAGHPPVRRAYKIRPDGLGIGDERRAARAPRRSSAALGARAAARFSASFLPTAYDFSGGGVSGDAERRAAFGPLHRGDRRHGGVTAPVAVVVVTPASGRRGGDHAAAHGHAAGCERARGDRSSLSHGPQHPGHATVLP